MLYVGLDTHLRTSTCCVLDAAGKQLELRTLRGPAPAAVAWLERLERLERLATGTGEELAVVFGASRGYGPLHDALARFCRRRRRVVVAHAARLRLKGAPSARTTAWTRRSPPSCSTSTRCRQRRARPPPGPRPIGGRGGRGGRGGPGGPGGSPSSCGARSCRAARPRPRPRPPSTACGRCCGRTTSPCRGSRARSGRRGGRAWLGGLAWPTPAAAALRCELLPNEWGHAERQVARAAEELDRLAALHPALHPAVGLLRTTPGVGPRTALGGLALRTRRSRPTSTTRPASPAPNAPPPPPPPRTAAWCRVRTPGRRRRQGAAGPRHQAGAGRGNYSACVVEPVRL